MSLQRRLNRVLRKTTGFEVKRAKTGKAPQPAKPSLPKNKDAVRPPTRPEIDRLLAAPIFIMSPVRSGSTLLRLLLNSHSQLHAPHELHVRRLRVDFETKLAEKSMGALDLNRADLEHLLWDRVLHRELMHSGKKFVVDKTPGNAFVYSRIAACWPDARFIFLLRHPVSIARSWHEARPDKGGLHEAAVDALRFMKAVEKARAGLSGLTTRYEDITADPQGETQRICEFLGLEWEPGMLEYGQHADGEFTKGLGDWKDKVRSGMVQEGRELPSAEEIPEELREISRAWGYLEEDNAS